MVVPSTKQALRCCWRVIFAGSGTHAGVDLPLDRFDEASVGSVALCGHTGYAASGTPAPPDDSATLGDGLQGCPGCRLGGKPLGLEMKELLLHLLRLFRLGFGERLSARCQASCDETTSHRCAMPS